MIDIFQKNRFMIVKAESLKTRYQNERHINTVLPILTLIREFLAPSLSAISEKNHRFD